MPLIWQEQSLLMEWCLDCHRHPERFVRPREYVFSMDSGIHQATKSRWDKSLWRPITSRPSVS